MKISTGEYFITETIASLRQNSLMSLASITTVALTLLILGMFLILVLNLNHMAANLESQVQISVYLKDDISEQQIKEVGEKIKAQTGVVKASYISKEEAMQRFRERLGKQQEVLTVVEGNPLPSSFEVQVDAPHRVKECAQVFGQLEGVESARYSQEIVEQLFSLTRIVRLVGIVIMLFLAFAAIFIISNTIRITVFARRREIGIMKFVGATDWFIRWPFLLEGIVLGFAGAVLAGLILNETYGIMTRKVYDTIPFLPIISSYPFTHYIFLILILAGTIIGAIGSTISLKRFMDV